MEQHRTSHKPRPALTWAVFAAAAHGAATCQANCYADWAVMHPPHLAGAASLMQMLFVLPILLGNHAEGRAERPPCLHIRQVPIKAGSKAATGHGWRCVMLLSMEVLFHG